MTVNAQLKLVVPLRYAEEDQPDPKNPGKTIKANVPTMWAYHTPISQDTFREHHRIIAAAKTEIFHDDDYDYATNVGITTADLSLLDAAEADAKKRGTQSMGPALLAEIQRLTMVSIPAQAPQKGFTFVLAETAIQNGIITEDEWHDLECVLVFFTCASMMAMRAKQAKLAAFLARAFGGSMTSSSTTEFAASLTTSTPAATSGVPPETTGERLQSSIPA